MVQGKKRYKWYILTIIHFVQYFLTNLSSSTINKKQEHGFVTIKHTHHPSHFLCAFKVKTNFIMTVQIYHYLEKHSLTKKLTGGEKKETCFSSSSVTSSNRSLGVAPDVFDDIAK